MADLCARFEGIRADAWRAMIPEGGSPPDGVIQLYIRPDSDARLGYAVLNRLYEAILNMPANHTYQQASGIVRLLSFYWPLHTSAGATFDDSGGKNRAIGPVLAPNKCQYLLDCWTTIDRPATEALLDRLPIFFELTRRPHAKFANATDLLDYLSRYAEFLQEAVTRDSFYFSFDGNCIEK
jgi:hypothetical protein